MDYDCSDLESISSTSWSRDSISGIPNNTDDESVLKPFPVTLAAALEDPQPLPNVRSRSRAYPGTTSRDPEGEANGQFRTSPVRVPHPYHSDTSETPQASSRRSNFSATVSSASSSSSSSMVEPRIVNDTQARAAQQQTTTMAKAVLQNYFKLKMIVGQRLLRRYYDVWIGDRQVGAQPTAGNAQATQYPSQGPAGLDGDSFPLDQWSPTTASSIDGFEEAERTDAGQTSPSPPEQQRFSYPGPMHLEGGIAATSRPSHLKDYGQHSELPPPRKSRSETRVPELNLPPVVPNPVRVVKV